MNTLTWLHTRKQTPMVLQGSFGSLWIAVLRVRTLYPNHPMFLDGKPL